jgi:uncharacterized membrane protein YphA (DoxX/SURF4 family)
MFWSFGRNDLDRTMAKNDLASLALRLALAGIFICVGIAKLRADWGTSWQVGTTTLVPGVQAAVAWCELIAGIALLLGFLTRLAALLLLAVQIGAVFTLAWHPEMLPRALDQESQIFNPAPGFWPFNYAIIAMCIAVLILGGGLFSVDFCLWRSFFGRRRYQAVETPAPLGGRFQSAPEAAPPTPGTGV